jgi:hypothetical protein
MALTTPYRHDHLNPAKEQQNLFDREDPRGVSTPRGREEVRSTSSNETHSIEYQHMGEVKNAQHFFE